MSRIQGLTGLIIIQKIQKLYGQNDIYFSRSKTYHYDIFILHISRRRAVVLRYEPRSWLRVMDKV